MSRAWMPLYIGDYLRDTGHLNTTQHGAYLLLIMHYWQHGGLPTSEAELATIARLPITKWRGLSTPIRILFDDDWTHGRIDRELAKTDRAIMQRRLAGRAGGIKSGLARAIMRSQSQADNGARRKRGLKHPRGEIEASAQACIKPPGTNQTLSRTSFLSTSGNETGPTTDALATVPVSIAPARKPAGRDVPVDAKGLSPSPELERIMREKNGAQF